MAENDMWQLPTRSEVSLFRRPRDKQTQIASPARLVPILSKLPKRWSRLILALKASDDIVWTV